MQIMLLNELDWGEQVRSRTGRVMGGGGGAVFFVMMLADHRL